MAITNGPSNTSFRFGSRSNQQSSSIDRPKAQIWANFGYQSDFQDEDGTYRFVSLSQGIPLDTIEDLPTNSRNEAFAAFQAARNDLRDQLLEAATKLAPGQAVIVAEDPNTGLCVQIRRVSEEVTTPTGDSNPFSRKLNLL